MTKKSESSSAHRAARRAALAFLFCGCVVSVVLFSVPDLIVFSDERMGKLISEAVPRFAVSVFLLAVLLDGGTGAPLPQKPALSRALVWCVPCFLVAFANFPYFALFSGSAKIERYGLLPLFLFKCLSVALMEELFFRALVVPFVWERLRGRFSAALTAVVTAAIFSLSHLFNLFFGAGVGGTLLQMGYTFLLGCMFAVMYLKTGRVWLCVLVHFLFDVGGLIVTDLGSGRFQDAGFWVLTAVAGAICAAHILFVLIRSVSGRDLTKNGER